MPVSVSAVLLGLLALGSQALDVPTRGQEPVEADPPWFVRHQAEDGRWQGDEEVGDLGVTALTLLAFLGDGQLPHVGPQRESMRRGLDWLLARQDASSGVFGGPLEDERALVTHAWCTLLVCELAHFDPEGFGTGEVHARAARALLAARGLDGGFGSARATGWATFALVAALESGLELPEGALQGARATLADAVSPLAPTEELEVGPLALSALIGWFLDDGTGAPGDSAATEALARLSQVPDLWPRLDPEERMLLAYAAYQAGGETWKRANRDLKAMLLPLQLRKPDEDHGGFPPERGFGAVRATAFGVLTLEVYFRYARLLGAR